MLQQALRDLDTVVIIGAGLVYLPGCCRLRTEHGTMLEPMTVDVNVDSGERLLSVAGRERGSERHTNYMVPASQ